MDLFAVPVPPLEVLRAALGTEREEDRIASLDYDERWDYAQIIWYLFNYEELDPEKKGWDLPNHQRSYEHPYSYVIEGGWLIYTELPQI